MIMKFNKLIFMSLLTSFCVFIPFQSEAKAVTVTKITDSKALKSYVEEVKAAYELYKQGKQLQEQIQNMQQALEHHDFKDLEKTYTFLADTVGDMNEILETADKMNTSITNMEDQWTEAHRDYDSKDVTDAKKAEWATERQKRKDASKARSTKILNLLGDPDKNKEELEQISKELKLANYGKGNNVSPVKQMQVLSQIMAHILKDSKVMQMYTADKAREAMVEKQEQEKEEKQREAEGKHNAEQLKENVDNLVNNKTYVSYNNGSSFANSAAEWKAKYEATKNASDTSSVKKINMNIFIHDL